MLKNLLKFNNNAYYKCQEIYWGTLGILDKTMSGLKNGMDSKQNCKIYRNRKHNLTS